MPILTDSEITSLTSDVRTVIQDDTISTDITFMLAGTTVAAWSPTSQLIPAMYTESGVSAFKGSYTLTEIEESDGLIEYGDVKFIIMADDVSGRFFGGQQHRGHVLAAHAGGSAALSDRTLNALQVLILSRKLGHHLSDGSPQHN